MFEEFVNKNVKVVMKDGDQIKVLRGNFAGIETLGTVSFLNIMLGDRLQAVRLENIEKVSEVDENDGRGADY